MWRDKQSKKIVYLQKVEFCLIDKSGNIEKVFKINFIIVSLGCMEKK